MSKLPIEFKKKWIAALRSGEYKQGKSWLYVQSPGQETTYCCLGVAACVLGVPIDYMDTATLTGVKHPCVTKEVYDAITSIITNADGHKETIQNVLMGMNDSQDKTFLEIADYIKQNF